jgi:hypothetical protein
MITIVIAIFVPLKIAGSERAAQAQRRSVGAGEAHRRRDDDRKEADEGGESDARLAADPKPDDKEGCQGDLRDQLKDDQIGVEHVAQERRIGDRDGEPDP